MNEKNIVMVWYYSLFLSLCIMYIFRTRPSKPDWNEGLEFRPDQKISDCSHNSAYIYIYI